MKNTQNNEQKKEDSIFIQEIKRDIATFRRVHGKRRLIYIYDYYRWKILAAIIVVVCLFTAANLLLHGQRPVCLRVCVVLNNEDYCTDWFSAFTKELKSDGNNAAVDVNQDQPFDYDSPYYNLHELEVMTTVSSQRMDAAVCGPDMYSYLLSLSALYDLSELASDELFAKWQEQGLPVTGTAGIHINKDGSEDRSNAVDGIYALDISGTAFGQKYNKQEEALNGSPDLDGSPDQPLYFCIISNTTHLDDALKLAEEISK